MAYRYTFFDYSVLAYFITHIPITLCIDAQSVLPSVGIEYPQGLQNLLTWYAKEFQDPLMAPRPVGQPDWFRAVCWIEILLQLPFFFVAVYAWFKKAEWIRIPIIIYGAHTATTLIPILGAFIGADIPSDKRMTLVAVYLPYLLMPLALMMYGALNEKLFAPPTRREQKSAKQH